MPRHHPHHLHRCFAFDGFASASPASFAPLFCFLLVCLGTTRIICTAVHHQHHLHRCHILKGFALYLQVCLGITRIICTAVLLFAGLLQHHQHHLHRCHILQDVALSSSAPLFSFCGFASASPASFAPLPHSAGFFFVCSSLPRH